MEINLNDYVWVQITDRGLTVLQGQHEELALAVTGLPPWEPPATDEEGWSKWQLWCLFDHFGIHTHMGPVPPFGMSIRLTDPAADDIRPSQNSPVSPEASSAHRGGEG